MKNTKPISTGNKASDEQQNIRILYPARDNNQEDFLPSKLLDSKFLPNNLCKKAKNQDEFLHIRRYTYITRLLGKNELLKLKEYLEKTYLETIYTRYSKPSKKRQHLKYTGHHYLLKTKTVKAIDGWDLYSKALYNKDKKQMSFGIRGTLKNDGTIEPTNIWVISWNNYQVNKYVSIRKERELTTSEWDKIKRGKWFTE
jgi:hypothetical protein